MTLNWQHVTDVFGGAIERSDSDRVQYLSDACSRNDTLGVEVADLLVSFDQMGDFLTAPAVIVADAASTAKKDSASQDVGRKIGPYEIEAVLGEGGRGTALLATDGRQQRQVVLKKLNRALVRDEIARDALLRDAKTLSTIKTPHIGSGHDIEEIYGEHYLVGHYVPGGNLRGLVEEGAVDPRAVITIGRQAAEALREGHSRGINHCNLKPENIIIGEHAFVAVVDYGLSHTPFIKANEALPAPGDPVGVSVSYMSPEQLQGPSADPRSDLFSLGVVLYELLTGRHPFAATDSASTVARIKTLHPPAPATIRANVPEALDRLVMKCLEKDPQQRPSSTDAIIEALRPLETHEGGTDDGTGDSLRTGSRSSGSRVVSPAAAAVRSPWITHQLIIITTMVAMGFLVWQVESDSSSVLDLVVGTITVIGAIISTLMRLQALIQASSEDFGARARRTVPVLIVIDLIVSASLLVAAVDLAGRHFVLSLVVAVMGVCLAVAAVFVEPGKVKAAFPASSA